MLVEAHNSVKSKKWRGHCSQEIADDGFFAPIEANKPIPPPRINIRKLKNPRSKLEPAAITRLIHTNIPTNRKNTVPKLFAIATREFEKVRPE